MIVPLKLFHGPQYLVLFVLATVPLLFGAIHPIVQGAYVSLVLLGLGGWWLIALPGRKPDTILSSWYFPLLALFVFILFQSLPLPITWIEWLSPARAERMRMVNMLAQGNQQYIAISDQGLAGLQHTFLILALIIYYVSLKILLRANKAFIHTIVGVITLVGVSEALYGLLQFLSPGVGLLWLPIPSPAAQGTIIYKNQYATLLNLCWPLACATVVIYLRKFQTSDQFQSRRKKFRTLLKNLSHTKKEIPLFFFATGIMMLAVIFSLSRGGIIAMFVVLVLLNFYLPISRKAKALTLGFIVIFVLSYGTVLGLDTVINRFNTLEESGATRISVYLGSLRMLKDHWATGIGLGSYTYLSPVYLKEFPPNVHFDQAHNEYLELAIELGIPAALLFFGWIGMGLYLAGKKLYSRMNHINSEIRSADIIGSAAFCALLGFFIHGMADFGWRLPANLFFAVTLTALLSFSLEQKHSEKHHRYHFKTPR